MFSLPHAHGPLRMMQAGLFDVLRGRFRGGQALHTVPAREQRLQSVVSNLSHLFNTRQGSLAHLPDYGLPDVTAAYRDNPRSVDDLRRTIRDAVRKYEPRLRRIRLQHRDTDRDEMNLVFLMTAELEDGQRVQLQTTFTSHEMAQVRPQHQSF